MLPVFLLPTFIGALRRHPDFRVIFLTNLVLGWTGVFYVVSLALAISGKTNPYTLGRPVKSPFPYNRFKIRPVR